MFSNFPKSAKLVVIENNPWISNPLNCEAFDEIEDIFDPNWLDTLFSVPVILLNDPVALLTLVNFAPRDAVVDWNPWDNAEFIFVFPRLNYRDFQD